ncbi:MAG: isoamylase early set domain-containing protein [Bacteroidetes bacterium]|nr:isoamylase early set domain-containing protein [Bacteroidota bacterium]
MALKKQFLKTKAVCKVTFTLPAEAVISANSVHLVGDFNDWSYTATPMKRAKDGSCSATLELHTGKEYQFRYLLDGARWENDWDADKYVATAFGDSENSIIIL